jgi:acetoin utilization deacetylase AcuC-like enzyme
MPGGVPFDPLRADRILAFLVNERLLRREEIRVARPASLANILRVHTAEYLRTLQRPETVTAILGAPVREDELESVLDLQRLMAGGTIHATRLALASNSVAVNLGGGFHHAEPARGMGFCVFNDVAVAIARLRHRGFSAPTLVVDLDLHDGNGTRAVFADDPTVYTLSIHNDDWGPTDAVASASIALGPDVADELYLGTLLKVLPRVMEEFRPRLVVFLAGCDVAEDDGLGNWRITAAGMFARDRFVVEQVRSRGLPLAVVLGGGYGDAAWRYTGRLAAWLLSGTEIEPPDNEALTLLRFRQIKSQLDPLHLTQSADSSGWELTEEDLVGILPGIPRQTRFLGYFSKVGIELILERFGILEQLRARGFRHPTLHFELDHPLGQTLRIFGDRDRRELLVELRVNRSARVVPGMEVILVEWLLLQNPRLEFTLSRRRLPGQSHPGLGMLREFFGLLVILAEELQLDGVLFNPAGYHIAALSSRFVAFVRPEHEAVFRALYTALGPLPLDESSRAVDEGRVVDRREGKPVSWGACPMVVPVSERLRSLVASDAYEATVQQTLETLDYALVPEANVVS